MSLLGHLDELRNRLLRGLLAIFIICLLVSIPAAVIWARPLMSFLMQPAQEVSVLQLGPGEFFFQILKVGFYGGLALSLPYLGYELLQFILPGLSRSERRLVVPAVAAATVLFLVGIIFAWWILVPAALRIFVSYGADVVEPLWSIERYLDFVLGLLLATGLAFQLPVLQVLLGVFGLVDAVTMLRSWRWVVLDSALAGAVLTPSTDAITMSLLSSAITLLFLLGVGLVALVRWRRPQAG